MHYRVCETAVSICAADAAALFTQLVGAVELVVDVQAFLPGRVWVKKNAACVSASSRSKSLRTRNRKFTEQESRAINTNA